jgi:hypothetical protein
VITGGGLQDSAKAKFSTMQMEIKKFEEADRLPDRR